MGYGLPKFEAQATVPTGGYSITVTDNAGAKTVTLAAGNYFINSATSLLSTLQTAFNAAGLAGTYTISSDDNSTTSTGKTTISSAGGGNVTIAWGSSTTLRNLLGFTGDSSGATSYTSASSCQYLWLPNVKRANPMVPDGNQGMPLSDASVTISPAGYSKVLQYNVRYTDSLSFRFLLGTKTWSRYESTANESWESFWTNALCHGYPLRYYPDRSDDATYATFRLTALNSLAVKPEFQGMVGGSGSDGSALLWQLGPLDMIKYVS